MIEYRLLGPIEVGLNGNALDIGGHKQRVLLAILLLSANKPVPRDVLVDRLWGEHPPVGAQHTLEVYVSRLRKTLEPMADGPVVVARPGAYLLRTPDDRIDIRRFERLAAQGRTALAEDAPDRAAADLREALALWRGAPLSDLSQELFVQAEIARLEELRASAIENRIDADLALGRHADLVGELQGLVEAHPFRERLYEQLMIALYRCGRQAEALTIYRAARRTFVEELGIEPSPSLRRVERAVLDHDASLQPTAPAALVAPMASTGSQLPLASASRRQVRLIAAIALSLAILLTFFVTGSASRPASVHAGPNTVGVIDAAGGELAAVVTRVGRPAGIAYGAGFTWIADSSDDQLLRVNSAHQIDDHIFVGQGPAGVTVLGGEVWVANEFDGTVSEVSPTAGKVVAPAIRVGNGPGAITSGYGSVWTANMTDNTLSRIAPASGSVVKTIPLGATPSGLAAGNGGIWVTCAQTGRLLFVNPRTNRVSRRPIAVGASPSAVAVGAGSVWIADSSGKVVRLVPATGRMRTVISGGAPTSIVYADGAVWVAGSHDGSVARIDPHTESVLLIHVGNHPAALAAAGADVLTTVLPSLASHRGGTLTLFSPITAHVRPGDPATTWDFPDWQMFTITNDGLLGFSREGGSAGAMIVPDLATGIPAPTDMGRTYTFRLRRGIKYSNGALVRPEDFRRELERVFKLNLGTGPASFYYSNLLGASKCERHPRRCDLSRAIVTDDKANTVKFHLAAPDPDFLYKLAMPFAVAVPAGTPDHPVNPAELPATGPYMTQSLLLSPSRFLARHPRFRDWSGQGPRPSPSWILVRNPRFREWSDQAQPGGYPNRIVARLGMTPEQGVKEVEQGRIDVFDGPPTSQLRELETRYASQLHTGPLAGTLGLILNTRVWPFNKLAARKALNYAVDRNKILGMLGGSLGGQTTCQILPPTFPGYVPDCPYTADRDQSGAWTGPDLTKATQLVHASGTAGAKVTVLAGIWDSALPSSEVGHYIVSILNRIGYRAVLRVVNDGGAAFAQEADSGRHTQIGEFSWYEDFPAPSDFFVPILTCQSFVPHSADNLNESEFCNHGIDAEIARARQLSAQNPNAADLLWAKIDGDVMAQAPWVPLFNPNDLVLLSRRVGDFQFDPIWDLLLDQLWVR